MSAPTLTFTPAMFHASRKGIKDTTRRLITSDCFPSTYGGIKAIGDKPIVCAHQPGEIKPMVTTWAVDSAADEMTPTQVGVILSQKPEHIWFNDGREKPAGFGKCRPGRFLPKALYPLAPQVKILTVTAEFLLDITEEGALREGISMITKDSEDRKPEPLWKYGLADRDGMPGTDDFGWPWNQWQPTAREAYFKLWDSINAARDNGRFAAAKNPACWVITYRPLPTTVQPQ